MTQRKPSKNRLTAAMVLFIPLALANIGTAAVASAAEKPSAAADAAQRSALRNELRRNLVAKKVPSVGVERTLAQLDALSMAELREMADFGGVRATGASRILPGASAQAGRDRASELLGSSGSSSSTASGNGMQQSVTGAMNPVNAFNDPRGQRSAGAATCAACPGTKSGRNPELHDPSGDGPKTIDTGRGVIIKIYGDGSASVTGADGKTEYLNSADRIVDQKNNEVPNATPRPDDQSPTTTTRITQGDIDRINGVLGHRATPNPDDNGSTGGAVDGGRADRTGSLGLFTDARPGAGYVSKADMQEVIRLSIEKLQGPQVGK